MHAKGLDIAYYKNPAGVIDMDILNRIIKGEEVKCIT